MLTRTIYTCEKCGLEIQDDYEKMLDHEYSHIEPLFQSPIAKGYHIDYPYPVKIIVKMSNGAKVEYVNPIEIEPPTEKESPSETD
jgi:hypothetical protein